MSSKSAKTNKQTLIIILVFTVFMVLGFEMVMPLVIVHFVNDMMFSATAVATALAIRQFSQQGLAIVGGALADCFDIRTLISMGVFLRAIGFSLLAFANNYPLLLVSMILIGFGGVLFDMPYQTAIAILTTEENRSRYYSLKNTVVGIAETVGPLLGVLLLRFDFRLVCFGAAACFLINFVISCFVMPTIVRSQESFPTIVSLKTVAKDKTFLKFALLMIVFWLAASQMNISFPLKAQDVLGSKDGVGIMWSIFAAVKALLQYPLVSLMLRRFNPRQITVVGIALNTLALVLVAFTNTPYLFFTTVVIFALGMLLARPNQQTIAVEMANSRAVGMYLGVIDLTFAIGNGFGTILGGALFDLTRMLNRSMFPWFIFGTISLIAMLGFLFNKNLGLPRKNEQETNNQLT